MLDVGRWLPLDRSHGVSVIRRSEVEEICSDMPPYVDTLNNMEPYTSQGMTCHQAGLKRCGRRSAESQAEPCSHDPCQAPVAPAVVRLQV
jgi:hypothetical protein